MRKYKYQINHYLSIQPKHLSIDGFAVKLRTEHDIPFGVFDKDRYCRQNEAYEIPEERLAVYAELLDVSVKTLIEERVMRYQLKQKKLSRFPETTSVY